jgi:Cytochrome b5-like Heme/Steroid binding domain/F-box-like
VAFVPSAVFQPIAALHFFTSEAPSFFSLCILLFRLGKRCMTFLDDDDIANNANLLYFTLLALSAITVFRRELSPNHRFAEEHVVRAAAAAATHSSSSIAKKKGPGSASSGGDIDWKKIESVLEGTGVLGAPLALVLVWMRLHALKSSHKGGKRRGLPKRGDEGEEFASSDGSQQEITMEEEEFPMHVEPGENLWKVLPNDVQVQVLSFLHPRDVMSFATVSRSCRAIKESSTLWKRLWLRDYGWVMTCWEPGMQALERSGVSLLDFDDYSARFYFCFAQCYLPYVLASHNTTASCLVGLGGHVYDLTSFLPAHPGSQETVLVNAGRCATAFFAGIRHSFTAQKLAQKLCVLVDMDKMHGNRHYASGLRPTMHTKLVESQYFSCANQTKALVHQRRRRRGVDDKDRSSRRVAGDAQLARTDPRRAPAPGSGRQGGRDATVLAVHPAPRLPRVP